MPQLGDNLLKCYRGQIMLLNEDNGIKDFWFPANIGKVIGLCCITKERNEI